MLSLYEVNITNTLIVSNAFFKKKEKMKYTIYSILLICGQLLVCSQLVKAQQDSGAVKNGYTRLYYEDGSVSSEGFMRNGEPDGYWKNYYRNGIIKSAGNRENFQLDGTWKFFTESGKVRTEISYERGVRNGPTRRYDTTGVVRKSTPYENDEVVGTEELFYPNGSIKERIPYDQGLKNGTGYVYARSDGRIINIRSYDSGSLVNDEAVNRYNGNDRKQGKWVTFHDNGVHKLVGPYVDGEKNGLFKEYDREGKLIGVYLYENGLMKESSDDFSVLTEKRAYYPDGTIRERASYGRTGKRQGYTYRYDSAGNRMSSEFYRNDVKLWEGFTDSLGRKQGPWTYFYPDTASTVKAEGRYQDDRETGLWKYYYSDGKLEQQGYYSAGWPDKKWEWFFNNGKLRREEHYRNGKLEGAYLEYDEYGYVLTRGKYVEGYRTGTWENASGDHAETGKYRDGRKDGEWKYYHYELEEENLYFVGSFKDGAPDGLHIYYYEPGQPASKRTYSGGLKDGSWIFYERDGTPRLEMEFEKGELVKINGLPFQLKFRQGIL